MKKIEKKEPEQALSVLEKASTFFAKITEGKLPERKKIEQPDIVGFDYGATIGTPVKVRGMQISPVITNLKKFKEIKGGVFAPVYGEKPEPYLTIVFEISINLQEKIKTNIYFLPNGKIDTFSQKEQKLGDGKSYKSCEVPEQIKTLVLERAPEWYHKIDWHRWPQDSRYKKWKLTELLRRRESRKMEQSLNNPKKRKQLQSHTR